MTFDDTTATRRSTAILRLSEGFAGTQVEDIQLRFRRHLTGGVSTILVDLDGVNYLNSTALALLVRFRREGAEVGVDVQLINVTHHVLDILRTTRLEGFFFTDVT